MAKRKRGGQPGNKNAAGHKGGNAYSPNAKRATAQQAHRRVISRQARATRAKRRAFAKTAIKGVALAAGAATVTVAVGNLGTRKTLTGGTGRNMASALGIPASRISGGY